MYKPDPNDPEEIIEEIIEKASSNNDAFIMSVPNDCLALIIGKLIKI